MSSPNPISAYLETLFLELPGFIDVRTIDADDHPQRTPVASVEETFRLVSNTGRTNVYVGLATRRTGSTAKGAGGKDELEASRVLWVDVDFKQADDESAFAEALETFPHPPSMVVSSGGGKHAYWLLAEPFDLTSAADVERFENVLKGIADYLGGDFAATDASRILRVPGTTNYPNAKKRAAGRKPAACKLDALEDGRTYAFDDFEAFEMRGARYRREKVEAVQYDAERFDGSCPAPVAALLEATGPKGNPRHPKLVERWHGDVSVLRGNAGDSELDQSIANLLAIQGVEPGDIENALRFRRQEYGGRSKHAGYFALTIAKALAWAKAEKAKESSPDRATGAGAVRRVCLNGPQIRDVLAEIETAVVEKNEPARLFRRTGEVVRVSRNDIEVGEAVYVEKGDYLNVVAAAADFYRIDSRKGDEHAATPTRDMAAAVFARLAQGRSLPLLRAVSPTPVMREDGSLFAAEGYDERTGVYFAPRPEFRLGNVPERPTQEDAQTAVDGLLAPFSEMAFATETDRSHFVAVLVTAVLRSWFPTVPFCVVEAPVQGSGKTLAAMAIRQLVEGSSGIGAAPEATKGNDAEWRKRITSVLLRAPSVVIFDNVVGRLGGPALAAIATSPMWSDRLLGKNDAPDLPNTPTWMFTTNNAQVDADLFRRCVFVRLDPDEAMPWRRTGFAIPDLLGHLAAHRGELLAHVYTLVRYWIQAGRPAAPEGTPELGSFAKWSQTVPAILSLAGFTGILEDLERRTEEMADPDEVEFGHLLEAWFECLHHLRENATVRAIADAAMTSSYGEIPLPSFITGGRSDGDAALVAKLLGRALSYRKDRWYAVGDGVLYRVRIAGGSKKKGLRWNIEQRTARADG